MSWERGCSVTWFRKEGEKKAESGKRMIG